MQSTTDLGVTAPAAHHRACARQASKHSARKQPARIAYFHDSPAARLAPNLTVTLASSEAVEYLPAIHDSNMADPTTTASENTVIDSEDFAVAMAKVADNTKGKDIMLLHVEPLTSWTSYMLLVTVGSKPQLNAVLAKMEQEAELVWRRPRTHKSPGRGSWEVLDFGDVVVHVMSEEQRNFYDMESFYGAAEEVDLPFTTMAIPDNTLQWTR